MDGDRGECYKTSISIPKINLDTRRQEQLQIIKKRGQKMTRMLGILRCADSESLRVRRLEWREHRSCVLMRKEKTVFLQLSPWWWSLTIMTWEMSLLWSTPPLYDTFALSFLYTPSPYSPPRCLFEDPFLFFTAQLHGKACSQRWRVRGANEVFPTLL